MAFQKLRPETAAERQTKVKVTDADVLNAQKFVEAMKAELPYKDRGTWKKAIGQQVRRFWFDAKNTK